MAAKTTQVELKGDRVQARSLAEAHVPRLMHDFRKNQSFQDLKIYSETKKFFDKTGAYVGTVYMQSVNGAENIVVSCDAGKPEVPKEETPKIPVPTPLTRIVPCIRSTDDQYWVACLSGTFEGPYRLFKNLVGVTYTDFLPANEANIDGQFLSTDGDYYLFYIAQSGNQPPFGSKITTSSNTTDYNVWEIDKWVVICPDGTGHLAQLFGATSSDITDTTMTVMGEDIGLPKGVDRKTWDMTNEDSRCGVSRLPPEYDEATEGEVLAKCDNPTYTYLPLKWWITDLNPFSIGVATMDRMYTYYGWGARYEDMSLEFDNKNNHAVQFAETQRDAHKTSIQPITNDDCSYTYHPSTVTESSIIRIANKLKVDEDIYTLSEVYSSDDEPTYYTQSIKYYNTNNIAAKTALLGSAVYTDEYVADSDTYIYHERYEYYYVGPNSQDELAKTEFVADYSKGTHTIPDIVVDGVPLEFDGMVFLGRLDYVMQL
jgi:hypothetical protein